jgi:hypothetical protein
MKVEGLTTDKRDAVVREIVRWAIKRLEEMRKEELKLKEVC